MFFSTEAQAPLHLQASFPKLNPLTTTVQSTWIPDDSTCTELHSSPASLAGLTNCRFANVDVSMNLEWSNAEDRNTEQYR